MVKLMEINVTKKILPFILALFPFIGIQAQELKAKVTINTSKLSGTKLDACNAFQQKAEDLLNTQQWTTIKFQEKERIPCTFSVTINKFSDSDGIFECSMTLNCTRPIWGTTYNSPLYSVKDDRFNFTFQEADQLAYNPDNIDNQLVALLAYYANVIIGMDLDTFSPGGGTTVLQTAQDIVTKADPLGYPGWSALNDNNNRYGLLNDYMDPSMETIRKMNYEYYRKGLDQMVDSTDKAKASLLKTMEYLEQANQSKSMSMIPQLFTEFKKDEYTSIFAKAGDATQRKRIYDILFKINPSLGSNWEKITK